MISDYNAVAELLNHGVRRTRQAVALALNAGVDIDMTSGAYIQCLPEALERGLVTMATIDASVRRCSAEGAAWAFNDPIAADRTLWMRADSGRRSWRETQRGSGVLLLNRTRILPLSPKIRLAVIGPLAAAPGEMLGLGFGRAGLRASCRFLRASGGATAMPNRSCRGRRH